MYIPFIMHLVPRIRNLNEKFNTAMDIACMVAREQQYAVINRFAIVIGGLQLFRLGYFWVIANISNSECIQPFCGMEEVTKDPILFLLLLPFVISYLIDLSLSTYALYRLIKAYGLKFWVKGLLLLYLASLGIFPFFDRLVRQDALAVIFILSIIILSISLGYMAVIVPSYRFNRPILAIIGLMLLFFIPYAFVLAIMISPQYWMFLPLYNMRFVLILMATVQFMKWSKTERIASRDVRKESLDHQEPRIKP
jgi:hypothetical protein